MLLASGLNYLSFRTDLDSVTLKKKADLRKRRDTWTCLGEESKHGTLEPWMCDKQETTGPNRNVFIRTIGVVQSHGNPETSSISYLDILLLVKLGLFGTQK